MPKFGEPVRRDRAARVHIRVDEGRQPARRLDDVIELESDLAQHAEVGTEAGRVHHDVGVHVGRLVVAGADHGHPADVGRLQV